MIKFDYLNFYINDYFFLSSYEITVDENFRQQLNKLLVCQFYLTDHSFHIRVQSPISTTCSKYLQESIMAVPTPKSVIKFLLTYTLLKFLLIDWLIGYHLKRGEEGGVCLTLNVQGQGGRRILDVAGQGDGGFLKIEQFSWTTYVYHP